MMQVFRSSAVQITVATVVAVAIAVGTLGFGATDAAASPVPVSTMRTQQVTNRINKELKSAEKHFNCANAEKVVTFVQRKEARMAKVRAKLKAEITKAQATHGLKLRAYLVHFWTLTLAKRVKHQSHLLGPKTMAKYARLAKIAENKCHVSAPRLGT